jgi:hypothetical protein
MAPAPSSPTADTPPVRPPFKRIVVFTGRPNG